MHGSRREDVATILPQTSPRVDSFLLRRLELY
jgi:hypothetical protein